MKEKPFSELNWRHLLAFALLCLLMREAVSLLGHGRDGRTTPVITAAIGTKALTLIFLFNHVPRPGIAEFLANLYSPYFYQVVFTGPDPFVGALGSETPDAVAVVDSIPESKLYFEGQRYFPCHGDHAGYFGYYCIAQVLQAVEDLGAGALYAGDDAALNVTALQTYPVDQPWATFELCFFKWTEDARGTWYWWTSTLPVRRGGKTFTVPMGYEALRYALSSLSPESVQRLYAGRPELATEPSGAHILHFGLSDVYYIPCQHSKLFMTLATHFRHYNVFLEIAVPHIFQILRETADYVTLRSCYLWDNERNHGNVANLIQAGDLDVLHPIKPSSAEGRLLMAEFVNGSRGDESKV